LLVLAVLGLYLLFKRTGPERASVSLWLATLVLLPSFFFQYVVWGLPFFLMAGYVPHVAVAQAVLFLPSVLFEARPVSQGFLVPIYVAMMLTAWVATAGAFVMHLRRCVAQRTV
jgi:hypothetical protein